MQFTYLNTLERLGETGVVKRMKEGRDLHP
jgi:hypothetical protein